MASVSETWRFLGLADFLLLWRPFLYTRCIHYHCHLITSYIELPCICKIIDFFYFPLVHPWYFFVTRIIQRTVCQPTKWLMQSPGFCCASICIVFCNFRSAWLWFSIYSVRRGPEEIFVSIMHASLSYF